MKIIRSYKSKYSAEGASAPEALLEIKILPVEG